MTIEKEAREIWEENCQEPLPVNKNRMILAYSACLKAKQDRIDELEDSLNKTMCVYCGFTCRKDANIIAKHIIEDCEKRPDSLVNMTKVLSDIKAKEDRINELESALKELIEASKVAYTPKLVQSYAMKSLLKAFKRAKKATGGGK